MSKNKGNTTIVFLAIAVILLLPAFFNKKTTTEEVVEVDKKEEISKKKEDKPVVTKIAKPSKPKTVEIATDPNKSLYKSKLEISYVYGRSNKADDEKIAIVNKGNEPVNLTGFYLETYGLEKFTIPKAYNLPGFSVFPTDNIVLNPGGELVIYVGTQDRKMDFRENICTGYFDEKSDFGGALSHRCPRIDVSKRLDFTDSCIKGLNSIRRCKMYTSNMSLDYACDEFATAHYSYAGCVTDYKDDKNFYLNRWFVWMQRTTEFFRSNRELIRLKDNDGKIIDEYRY